MLNWRAEHPVYFESSVLLEAPEDHEGAFGANEVKAWMKDFKESDVKDISSEINPYEWQQDFETSDIVSNHYEKTCF